MRTVFITGCATGFGHLLAKRLLADGHRVVATDQAMGSWTTALAAPQERLLCLEMDVRKPQQVQEAVGRALAWGPVDTLVNNAGYAVFGTQEELDLALVQHMFDVNVVGVARVTQALLPTLRACAGTVVQLSSVAGRTVFTESGFYAASKYAVEAMTEALWQETFHTGLKVRLIEPGSFATQFLPTAQRISPEPPADSPYAAQRATWAARKDEALEPPQDPHLVVDAIVHSLAAPERFLRVPVGLDSQRILALRDSMGPDDFSRHTAEKGLLPDE